MIGTASRARFFATALLATLVSAAPGVGAAAQEATPPDFSSNQTAWAAGIGNAFSPVPGAKTGPLRQDPAYPYVPNNAGAQPTYFLADLTHPNLKPWVKEAMKKDNDEVLAGKIAFTPRSSCKPAGVPNFMLYGGGSVFFIQTPKQVVMIFDGDQQVRRIYMDVPHSPNPKPSWYGESVGHYEGDTLVIDTIGLSTKTVVDNFRTPHTEKLHVIERWRMVEDGNALEVQVTVEDPDTYYEPWQGMRRYRRTQETLGEEYCAENNLHLFDYGVPQAMVPDF